MLGLYIMFFHKIKKVEETKKILFPETSGDMVGVMGDHVGVIYEVFDESKKS